MLLSLQKPSKVFYVERSFMVHLFAVLLVDPAEHKTKPIVESVHES